MVVSISGVMEVQSTALTSTTWATGITTSYAKPLSSRWTGMKCKSFMHLLGWMLLYTDWDLNPFLPLKFIHPMLCNIHSVSSLLTATLSTPSFSSWVPLNSTFSPVQFSFGFSPSSLSWIFSNSYTCLLLLDHSFLFFVHILSASSQQHPYRDLKFVPYQPLQINFLSPFCSLARSPLLSPVSILKA